MFDVIIKNGTLVYPDKMTEADIGIKDGKIAAVAQNLNEAAGKTIDADGKYIYAGLIDCHVHSAQPGYSENEDYPHVTRAAAAGGITTILDMPCTNNPTLSNHAAFLEKQKAAAEKAVIDYGFWGACFPDNSADLQELAEDGVVAFKSFLSPSDESFPTSPMEMVEKELRITKELGMTAGFHCEDFSIVDYETKKAISKNRVGRRDFLNTRPLSAEITAVTNVIEAAKRIKAKVHICHVTHPKVAELISQAKAEGTEVTAETCGSYLTFDENDLIEKGSLFKCTPPLRESGAKEGLWEYIKDGTLDCIASDHSPSTYQNKDDKTLGIFGTWCGISSIQSLFQAVFSEGVNKRQISPCVLARCFGTAPADIFGLKKKGALWEGMDADITIVDPKKEWEIKAEDLFYVNQHSAFTGLKGRGMAVCTLSKGQVVAENGKIVTAEMNGRLLKRGG